MLLNFSDRTRTGVFNMIWPQTEVVTVITHVNKKKAIWRHLSQNIVSPEILALSARVPG